MFHKHSLFIIIIVLSIYLFIHSLLFYCYCYNYYYYYNCCCFLQEVPLSAMVAKTVHYIHIHVDIKDIVVQQFASQTSIRDSLLFINDQSTTITKILRM